MLRRAALRLEIGAPKLENEPFCGLDSADEEKSADQCLDDVADDIVALARAILARLAAQTNQRRHADLPAILGAGGTVDEAVVSLRQVTLGLVRVTAKERRGD